MLPWRCPVPEPGVPAKDLSDLMVLAMTILGEAEGECDLGKLAVGWVVRNRKKDRRWPDTTTGVCLQPMQFSCWNTGSPRIRVMKAPVSHTTEAAWDECFFAAIGAEFAVEMDPTNGANHYHTTAVEPYWADNDKVTLRLGDHIFYKL